jgi:phosphopantetheine adenylyltransferase
MTTGKLIWHVACDESGIDGQVYYGFGSLWMKYQRRGDFTRIIRELREKHNYHNEIKWQKAHKKFYAEFYADLIETLRKAKPTYSTFWQLEKTYYITVCYTFYVKYNYVQ